MKLDNVTKDLRNMSDQELREHVKHVRHNKYVARPAKAKHAADITKVEKRQAGSKINKVIDAMSDNEKQQLILLLGGSE